MFSVSMRTWGLTRDTLSKTSFGTPSGPVALPADVNGRLRELIRGRRAWGQLVGDVGFVFACFNSGGSAPYIVGDHFVGEAPGVGVDGSA